MRTLFLKFRSAFYLRKVYEYLEEGDFRNAIAALKKVAPPNENEEEIVRLRTLCHIELGELTTKDLVNNDQPKLLYIQL